MILAIFVSGNGSNMKAIINACRNGDIDAEVGIVVSQHENCKAIHIAQNAHIPTYTLPKPSADQTNQGDHLLLERLYQSKIDLIVLAGFTLKIGKDLIESYRDRIFNIHPSLLPKFGGKGMYGMNVHKAVLASGANKTGATVHLVSEQYDSGKILAQKEIHIDYPCTPDKLAQRVLRHEHKLYVDTLNKQCKRLA